MKKIINPLKKIPINNLEKLVEYVASSDKELESSIKNDPKKKKQLENYVQKSVDKYKKYINTKKSIGHGISQGLGYGGDFYTFSTGDIITGLGVKFLSILSRIPEKINGVYYGIKTNNYLDAGKNIVQGLISYIPGLTFMDRGLNRIIKERVVKEAKKNYFKQEKKDKNNLNKTNNYDDNKYLDDILEKEAA